MRLRSSVTVDDKGGVVSAHDSRGHDGCAPAPHPAPAADGTGLPDGIPAIYSDPYHGCFSGHEARVAFAELFGAGLPKPIPVRPFTVDSTVQDMGAVWLGRRLFGIIDWAMAEPSRKMDHVQRAMMKEMAADMPLRSMVTSGVPLKTAEGLVDMLNGHYVAGLTRAVRALLGMVRGR